jgi:hypothetical protein
MLPSFVTHYFERDRGPFLNVCDISDAQLDSVIETERNASTAFNRFALGAEFFEFRRAADDLLIESYRKKFNKEPEGRPFYGVLGEFDKTLGMYRDGQKIRLSVSDFESDQITFMYPDHAHLISYSGSAAPQLFYQLPPDWKRQAFWGQLFTYQEICDEYFSSGIGDMIESWISRDGWAGCYVEAHIWNRSLRKSHSEQGAAANP